jgi:hypothetical protein
MSLPATLTIASGQTQSGSAAFVPLSTAVTFVCSPSWGIGNFATPYASRDNVYFGPVCGSDGAGSPLVVYSGNAAGWSASLPRSPQGQYLKLYTNGAVDRDVRCKLTGSPTIAVQSGVTTIASGAMVSSTTIWVGSIANPAKLLVSPEYPPGSVFVYVNSVAIRTNAGSRWAVTGEGVGCFPHGMVTSLSINSGASVRFETTTGMGTQAPIYFAVVG